MSNINVNITEGFNLNNSSFETNRPYQHVSIGNFSKKKKKVMPTFMNSTSCLSSTLKTLCLRNIQIQSDIFIRCIGNLKNLRELRLHWVKCSDESFQQDYEELNSPQLNTLYIDNCESRKLIEALIKLKTQSKQIEFDFNSDNSLQLVILVNKQKCLESLFINRMDEEDIDEREDLESFFALMLDYRVKHENLKKIVIYEDPSIENLSPLFPSFSNFLTESAHNLQELHLTTLEELIVETIANFMKIETLSYSAVEEIPWRRLQERIHTPNNFLKKLVNKSEFEDEVSDLLSIFTSVETLVSLYAPSMMEALQNSNSLKNLSLECGNFNSHKIPAMILPTVKTVHFYLSDFRHMKQFLETNCRTIETLIVKDFRVRSDDPANPPTNVILEFFSKFKRVVLLNVTVNRLELLRAYDTAKYQGKVFEVETKTFWKAYRKFGATSNVVRLLKYTSHANIRKMQEIFEVDDSGSLGVNCFPKRAPDDSDFSDCDSIDIDLS